MDKIIKLPNGGVLCEYHYDGDKFWFLNGERHREDGPAIDYANGTKEWYINNIHHRINGPAVERSNGDRIWYINGEIHREDGPAIEWGSGQKEWYLNGQYIHCKTQKQFEQLMRLKAFW